MLKSVKELNGYDILSLDGLVGHVHDFYFDDVTWILRYLVVDTGTWLPGRKVLISPVALERPNRITKNLAVNLTTAQIKSGPDIDTDKPISRREEFQLTQYYQWPDYWQDVTPVDAAVAGIPPTEYLAAMRAATTTHRKLEKAVSEKIIGQKETHNPHLRSTNEVIGYNVYADNERIGHIEDFIYNNNIWTLHYLVIDTGNWLPGKKVLIAPAWIEKIIWLSSKVQLNLPKALIENSPEYDPSVSLHRSYESKLYRYYGRPGYWN